MSRGKKLGVLLGILAVVILAIVITAAVTRNKEEKEVSAAEKTVATIPSDQVTELQWSYDGEQMHFVRRGDTWVNADDESFPADEDLLNNMLNSLSEVKSYKSISGSADRSDYGLEPAVVEIAVTADKEYSLKLGNETSIDGSVYASMDDGKIFLTDSILKSQFARKTMSLLKKETVPEMDSVQSMEIRSGDKTISLEYDDSSNRAWDDSYVWFAADGGNTVTLDTDKSEGLIQTIKYLQWTDTVAYPADESQLSAYGLAEPAYAVLLSYTGEDGDKETLQVDIGNKTEDGYCYGTFHGSDRIYRTDGTVYDDLAAANIQDLRPDDVLKMDWNSVKSMDLILDETAYPMTRIQKKDTVEEASKEEETWEWNYEDRTVDLTEALEALTGLTAESMDPATPEGDTAIAFLIERNTANYPQVQLTIWELDEEYYGITLNGEHRLKISREKMDPVIEQFQNAIK